MLIDDDRVNDIIIPMLIAKYRARGLSPSVARIIALKASQMAAKGEIPEGFGKPDPARPIDVQYADFMGMKALGLRHG